MCRRQVSKIRGLAWLWVVEGGISGALSVWAGTTRVLSPTSIAFVLPSAARPVAVA